jgi:hypothetical protein
MKRRETSAGGAGFETDRPHPDRQGVIGERANVKRWRLVTYSEGRDNSSRRGAALVP